jgi:hypothetical protein
MMHMLFPFTLCIFTYVRLTTQVTCGCSDGDENIVFDEDEEADKGFFRGTRYTSLLLSHVKISLKPTYSTLDLC